MTITVKYFANLKEMVGRDQDEIEYRAGLTVADIWKEVKGDISDSTAYLTAVNMEYAKTDAQVSDGDEVAFFPKVSGG